MQKKYRFMVTSALFLLLCVSAAFCKDQTAFVDHQDRSIGKPVPQWVIDAFNGNVTAAQKSLGLAKNTKLFLVSGICSIYSSGRYVAEANTRGAFRCRGNAGKISKENNDRAF